MSQTSATRRPRISRGRPSQARLALRVSTLTLASLLAGVLVPVVGATPAAAASATTFSSPGTYSYTVPAGVTSVAFAVAGSPGAPGWSGRRPGQGGGGGLVTGEASVSPGQVLIADVGGRSSYPIVPDPGGAGGFFSGGPGGAASDLQGLVVAGGGGGGGGGGSGSAGVGLIDQGGAGGSGSGGGGKDMQPGTADTGAPGQPATAGGGGGAAGASPGAGGSGTCPGAPGYPGSDAFDGGSGGSGGMGANCYSYAGGGGGGGGGWLGGGGGGGGGASYIAASGLPVGGGGGGGAGGESAVLSRAVTGVSFCDGCNRAGNFGAGLPNTSTTDNGFVVLVPVSAAALTPWVVALTAAAPTAPSGGPVALLASADQSVTGTGYAIEIFDTSTGGMVAECGAGQTCSAVVSETVPAGQTTTSQNYLAYVAALGGTYPPSGVQASSDPQTVTWLAGGVAQQGATPGTASGTCALNGGQQVVDETSEGVTGFVYTWQPSSSQFDVCFRAQDSVGVGFGGLIAITPTAPGVSIGGATPPSADNNGSTCTTTTPNAVPGSHPISSGGVAGVPYLFDAYSNGASTAWVCVQVGSVVDERVVVPVSAPSVTVSPGYEVTFYPDPGTP